MPGGALDVRPSIGRATLCDSEVRSLHTDEFANYATWEHPEVVTLLVEGLFGIDDVVVLDNLVGLDVHRFGQ